MRKKIYTKKDFEICRILVICFIIIDFICVMINWLMRVMEIPELIKVLAFSGALLMPILVVMTCCMCIERYWYLEFFSEESDRRIQSKMLCGFGIMLMLLLGYATLYNASDIIEYITYNWNLRERLNTCVTIKGGITFCWLVFWIFSIIRRRNIAVCTGIKKWLTILGSILLVVVLLFITIRVNAYVDAQADSVYWDKFIEHENKYGALVKPFSRN